MKRSQMYKKVNRRQNVFNHFNRNVVYPSLFVSPDEINKYGSVEIIELKSDEEPEEELRDKSNSHVCHENEHDSYRINKEARERRRCRLENDNEIYNELFDRVCTNFYGIDCHNYDGSIDSREAKCFTIINNNITYTSSDDDMEDYSDITLNENSEAFHDSSYNNGYTEKRTVCIYSEKNKELSEEYELNNITSKNSTSSSTDNEDSIRDINLGYIRNLATPIPNYVPKLFIPLSPTLPTVTEVMESYNKSSSNTDINQSMTPQMPINNWVQESLEEENEDTNIWNALSPREKRRIKNSMKIDKIAQESIKIATQPNSADGINGNEMEPQISECIRNANEVISESSSLEINNQQRPQIKINRKKINKSDIITEPLEKENGKWIGGEIDETINVYDYDLDQDDAKDTSNRHFNNNTRDNFLVTNMSLLKPTEWTQYLPITGSVPSLHLSLTEIEEKSCFLTLFKCFKCCKRNK